MLKKILLIEDNPDHVAIIQRIFKKLTDKYSLEVSDNVKDAVEKVSRESFDLVLSDYSLAGNTALEVLEELKKHEIYIPLVVVTSAGSEKIAVELMKAGAYDYVIKDESFEGVLPIVLERSIDRFLMKKSNALLQAEIKKQAEFIKLAIDALAYPFYVVDRNYTIILVNAAGRKKGITVGNKCHKVTHKLDEPCTGKDRCPLKEVVENRIPIVLEHIHYDSQGKERFVEVHGDPIFDADGEVEHMIEYSIDITDRKIMEEELNKKIAELEIFNKSAVNREIKMIELKKKISELEGKSSKNNS